jgi:hypothetical protein
VIDPKKNYIFDFVGYHGIIDDKVRMWIKLKEMYGRNIANTVMPKTYLMPNDYDLFINEFGKPCKKYIVKNSFGGARGSLQITKSKDEILTYFSENKLKNYDPYLAKDAFSHSAVKYNIVQEFMNPTFLINGYKIGLRLYVVPMQLPDGTIKKLLWKNGSCYYSSEKYIDNENIDNNVVGSIFKIAKFIDENNLPFTYKEFTEYIKDDQKIRNFEEKIVKYIGYILTSNEKELFYFGDCKNVSKFSIFAFDIEFNENFDPVIYEGNFYFVRRIFHPKYGVMIQELYEDILYEMNVGIKKNIGFFDL